MATTIPNSLLKYSGTSILDLLQSSRNGVLPLKSLGKTNSTGLIRRRRRDLSVSTLIKKGEKKDEHPWPDDADPNVKGGVLSHLSHFKPLKTKPKPVTLYFERPLMDLEKKIIDVRKMAQETGLDFSDQIIMLQNKYEHAYTLAKTQDSQSNVHNTNASKKKYGRRSVSFWPQNYENTDYSHRAKTESPKKLRNQKLKKITTISTSSSAPMLVDCMFE